MLKLMILSIYDLMSTIWSPQPMKRALKMRVKKRKLKRRKTEFIDSTKPKCDPCYHPTVYNLPKIALFKRQRNEQLEGTFYFVNYKQSRARNFHVPNFPRCSLFSYFFQTFTTENYERRVDCFDSN